MIIDIRNLPTYYINLSGERERRAQIYRDLHSHGFKNIKKFPATYGDNRIGCSISHNKILEHIIQKNEYPCLILEDDAKILNDNFILEIPDNIDAFYLGLGQYGTLMESEFRVEESIKISELSDNFHRVHNMVTRHAVIHFNPDYDKESILANNVFLENPNQYLAGDVALSFLNEKKKVYALNNPIFFQSDIKTRPETEVKIESMNYTILN